MSENSRSSSSNKFASTISNSVASLRSIMSSNKIQPYGDQNSEIFYEIKDFDNYVDHSSMKSLKSKSSTPQLQVANNNTCGKKFCNVLRRAWSTRYTEDVTSDRIRYLKTAFRELITYIVFLIFLILVAYGTKTNKLYYLTAAMTNVVLTKSFNGITAMDSFWTYLSGDLMSALYWDTWYNNLNVSMDEKEFIYFENKLVGVPQIRQLRVKSDSCHIPLTVRGLFSNCYGDFSGRNSNKTSFGAQNATAWTYSPPARSKGHSFSGNFANYEDGGFIQELTRDSAESKAIISKLQSNLWTDHSTRAVFVDFTVYNANVNLYCVTKLIFEFPAVGGVVTMSQIKTVKLLRYETTFDFFILGCEMIVIIFIIYYAIEEVLEISRNRLAYFTKVWNVLDVVMIVLSFVSIAMNIYRVIICNKLAKELVADQNVYQNFDFVQIWDRNFNEAISITAFFGIIKIFKYISFNKTMNQLTDTLGNSLKEILGFAVMFFIVFFAFAQWGYLQFGSQILDFCRFQDSVFTLFRLILGDFSLENLLKANSLIGPIYYISYVFFVFFVLINMFVAIINDSYYDVKERLIKSKDDLEISKFIQRHFFNRVKRNKIIQIQEVLEDVKIANCEQLSYLDWRDELQKRGYADVEIQALFLQYDLDGDRTLDYEERRKMLNDFKNNKVNFGQFDSQENQLNSSVKDDRDLDTVDEELFNDLVDRVDDIEKSVCKIVTKIDDILVRLADMEIAKLNHQKSVGLCLSIVRGSQINVSI